MLLKSVPQIINITFVVAMVMSALCWHVRSFFGSISASRTSQTLESAADETKDLLVKQDLSNSLSGFCFYFIFLSAKFPH